MKKGMKEFEYFRYSILLTSITTYIFNNDRHTYVKKTYIRVYVHYLYRIIMKTIEENLRFLPLCQNDIMEKSVSVLIKQISIFS